MSKDPTTGLFSKVARLVRSPSSRWGEPSGMGEAEDSGQGKQLLKEMIERKRRNDFVRKREFAELRRLRQREALSGRMLDTQGRPSFFQTSLATRPDDRAVTLRKIDEIEAQMSMQWWRGRDPEPGAEATGANDSANPISAFAVEPESHTQPLNLATGATTPESLERAFAPTQTGPSTMMGEGVTEMGLAPTKPMTTFASTRLEQDTAPASDMLADMPEFEFTRPMPDTTPVFEHIPAMEPASIRFANGDPEGAEADLLALLRDEPALAANEGAWMVLFDLYRAVGWREKFESAAIDFACRFSRSSPQWLELGKSDSAETTGGAMGAGMSERPWVCPAVLDASAVRLLEAALQWAASPWRFDWAALQDIQADALPSLRALMERVGEQDVNVEFLAGSVLDSLLRSRTVSGDATVAEDWWLLRMAVLRVQGRDDSFELVALDYCVTYERSPPSWVPPRCRCRLSSGLQLEVEPQPQWQQVPASPAVEPLGAFAATSLAEDAPSEASAEAGAASLELYGEVLGDVVDFLPEPPPDQAVPATLVVDCNRLVRIDFAAAGALLNWASARQTQGMQVQLRDVQRLVVVFLTVIGLPECARVIPRRD